MSLVVRMNAVARVVIGQQLIGIVRIAQGQVVVGDAVEVPAGADPMIDGQALGFILGCVNAAEWGAAVRRYGGAVDSQPVLSRAADQLSQAGDDLVSCDQLGWNT